MLVLRMWTTDGWDGRCRYRCSCRCFGGIRPAESPWRFRDLFRRRRLNRIGLGRGVLIR